jgi:hypothetical protein
MTDHDHIVDLADRATARCRRGENWEAEFEVELGALTAEEMDEFMALLDQRQAHGGEKTEALEENVRILTLLFLYEQGKITAMEFVERVRGVLT